MGTIKTTNIETITGSGTLTLGQSGETISVPSGATINLSNATQTGVGGENTPAFRATMASAQSIPTSTYTLLNYDTVDYNTGVTYNTTDKTFTVPSGQAGKYYFMAATMLLYGDNSGEYGDMYIQKNGTDAIGRRHVVEGDMSRAGALTVSGFLNLAVGDVIRARIWFNQGDARSTSTGIWTFFSGYKLIGV
jgi:hypothetical protein